MGRIIIETFFGLLIFGGLLALVYQLAKSRPKPQLDVSSRPSMWWADNSTSPDGRHTIVGIVRVDNHTKEVLERRILTRINNDAPDYSAQFDAAYDRAYDAQRKANLGLNRR
jgi:hypothetical protein